MKNEGFFFVIVSFPFFSFFLITHFLSISLSSSSLPSSTFFCFSLSLHLSSSFLPSSNFSASLFLSFFPTWISDGALCWSSKKGFPFGIGKQKQFHVLFLFLFFFLCLQLGLLECRYWLFACLICLYLLLLFYCFVICLWWDMFCLMFSVFVSSGIY